MKPFLKLITEVGPLAVFFIGNAKYGIFYATGAFMIATAIAIPISWKIEGKLPIMPIVIGIFVVFFGSLTLLFQDETFRKRNNLSQEFRISKNKLLAGIYLSNITEDDLRKGYLMGGNVDSLGSYFDMLNISIYYSDTIKNTNIYNYELNRPTFDFYAFLTRWTLL